MHRLSRRDFLRSKYQEHESAYRPYFKDEQTTLTTTFLNQYIERPSPSSSSPSSKQTKQVERKPFHRESEQKAKKGLSDLFRSYNQQSKEHKKKTAIQFPSHLYEPLNVLYTQQADEELRRFKRKSTKKK